MDDDEIVYDRDTSAPKNKLKERKRRKGKAISDDNESSTKKVLLSQNIINNNNDKNGKNINNTDVNKDKSVKNKNNNNDLEKNKMKINISLSNADENNKNKIESGYLYSSNNKSDNNKTINEKDNLDDNLNNEDLEDNGEPLKDNEEFLKAYNDAMNSGNKDRVISILKKRLDHYELSITELQMIIQHLRNDIHKKEKLMNLLTKTNTSLKKSLNDFSKQLDDKILAMNEKQNPINVKKLKISKTPNKFTIKNDGDDKKSKNDEEKQYTEINNVLALNKIYQKDNENLKILLNSYGSVDKKKELENINKSLKEEYNNLNEEMIELKKKYLEHSYCEKKKKCSFRKNKIFNRRE